MCYIFNIITFLVYKNSFLTKVWNNVFQIKTEITYFRLRRRPQAIMSVDCSFEWFWGSRKRGFEEEMWLTGGRPWLLHNKKTLDECKTSLAVERSGERSDHVIQMLRRELIDGSCWSFRLNEYWDGWQSQSQRALESRIYLPLFLSSFPLSGGLSSGPISILFSFNCIIAI